MVDKPGYYRGRHFTGWVEAIKELKRAGRLDDAIELLGGLVEATEAEARVDSNGVAPWYYEQLAIIHRKRRDLAQEVAILQRYADQRHAPGQVPQQMAARLRKARELLRKAE
ncbi:MAG TPA: hypothetical protein VFF32_04855 [Dermatophilaceae bacterium]|nr:hypothetical protein [Dermatophilaceae bacterium]